jgi:hypothetical protein
MGSLHCLIFQLMKSERTSMVAHACSPSYTGDEGKRIIVQGMPCAKVGSYLKNKLKQKGLGGMAQVVKHLLASARP